MHYFLIYVDGTHNDYIGRLVESVKQYGPEFEIVLFNKQDISEEFMTKHKSIFELSRGGGYWLWKPYIINETLKRINDDDIIFYLDSKYYFIAHFKDLYENYMKENDIMAWKNKPNELIWYMKNWCKMDVIVKYDMYQKVFDAHAEDCWGGALIVKKNATTVKYIQEWLDMCCIYENITDSPSILPNDPVFREHRHDQSLLSIILHKYNITLAFFEKKYLQNVRQYWTY